MKLSKDFILHISDGEAVLVPTGKAKFSGVVRGNKTLGAVLELLQGETTEARIIQALRERFDAPEDVIARDVKKAVEGLRKIGAVTE